MIGQIALGALLTLAVAEAAVAQPVVFVVRHAERSDAGSPAAGMMAADPGLSATGHARAEALADVLRDANITAIYVTEYRRTQQTAAPAAKARGLTPIVVPAKDLDTLVTKLRASAGNVLVVGHSNTVPEILERLGDASPIELGEADYDNLFVIMPGQKATVLRLHFQ